MEVDEGQGEAGEAEDGLYGGHRVEDSLAQEPPHQEHLPHLTTPATSYKYFEHEKIFLPQCTMPLGDWLTVHSHLEYLDDDQQQASTPHNVLGKISY